MKLLLVAALAICLGQLQAGPVASPTALVATSDSKAEFFDEFNKLLGGIAKEALESLSLLGENTRGQLQSVENALGELETLYNEKVQQEIEKYAGAFGELENKVSPCFAPVGQEIRDIVEEAREGAEQCAQETLARVQQIEKNIEEHANLALGKVQGIVAIGTKCLSENSWIVDQINCALQNAPVAVRIVQDIVQDAAKLIGQTSRDVSELASDTEQCLAVVVQDAVVEFNTALEKVINCLAGEETQADLAGIESA
uniref:Protein TsetseEP domain-containing protein n=1 Tax=Anopheles atroparvus TaxID=41427 RepID=A0AAG5CXC2_ANOAO